MKDFSKKTLSSLSKKGISLIGLTIIPGTGDLPFATGERGYILNDNGCQRILTFFKVLELAGKTNERAPLTWEPSSLPSFGSDKETSDVCRVE